MSTVVNRITKEVILSANTPKYPVVDWIINPDLAGVEGVPNKYWNISGDIITEMTRADKTTVDATEQKKIIDDQRAFEKGRFTSERGLDALLDVFMDEFNNLRGQHGLSPWTRPQLRSAIEKRIDEI